MVHNTDPVIYLWVVPVICFFLLPIALAVLLIPLLHTRNYLITNRIFNREKRRHPRHPTNGDTLAQITIANTTCTALISNISQTGICLEHLPEIFSYKINKVPVVIRQYGMECNLLIKTRWTELTESGKKIGAEVDIASPEWSQLLLQTGSVR